MSEQPDSKRIIDLRHIGRVQDKDMPIDRPGMEMSKPGAPDMRRRKHTIVLPNEPDSAGPEDPPQNLR